MSGEEGRIALALGFLQKAPERAARILELHAPACGVQLLERVDAEIAAAVLCCMTPRHAAAHLDALEDDPAAGILRCVSAVAAAPVLRALAARRRAALLRRLPSRQAVTLNWLLSHPDNSVGAWTDARAFTLSAELSAQEALAQIRDAESAPGESLYVLGRQGRLQGVVTATGLLRAANSELVGGLCSKPPAPLQAQASLASAASLHGWQLHNALPVVERNQQFVGVLERDALERGLMHGGGEEPSGRLTDTLLEATQAYWSGLSALWQTTFGLLTAPAAREERPPGSSA
jgi:Mg/Co/Ni transporter MgtE